MLCTFGMELPRLPIKINVLLSSTESGWGFQIMHYGILTEWHWHIHLHVLTLMSSYCELRSSLSDAVRSTTATGSAEAVKSTSSTRVFACSRLYKINYNYHIDQHLKMCYNIHIWLVWIWLRVSWFAVSGLSLGIVLFYQYSDDDSKQLVWKIREDGRTGHSDGDCLSVLWTVS